ncbi:MAG: YoaK family protein [Nitrosomonadales bacterium]|nr:YoaK family protein [Nitrosomonadales bacterium]
MQTARHSYLMIALLSFIGGYVDTFGFIALFGLFTAHITGNFVLMGAMLVHPMQGGLLKLLAFPAFLLGVAASRIIVLNYEQHRKSPLKTLFVVQGILLIGFMIAGLQAPLPLESDTELAAIFAGMLGAAAMAIQSAGGRTTLAGIVHTTVMTGNVTHMIIDITDMLYSKNIELRARAKTRLRQLAPAVSAFSLGALSAAFGYLKFGYWSISVPILLLGILFFSPMRRLEQESEPFI